MKKSQQKVKRFIVVALSIASITLLYFPAREFYRIEQVKERVRRVLKDPDSAKFERVILSSYSTLFSSGCGYVNAKNGMGGYTGLKGFVAYPDGKVYFEQSTIIDREQKIKQGEFLAVASYCSDYFFPSDQSIELIGKLWRNEKTENSN